MSKLRLVAYLRVSSAAQVKTGMGLEIQESLIRKWAKEHDYRIVATHSDNGVSGTLPAEQRPGALACLEAVTSYGGKRKADGIVALNMGRFARQLHIQEAFLELAWRRGARVFTVDEEEERPDRDDDPYRRFIRQVRGSVQELEKNLTVQRMQRGKDAGQAKGLRSQGGQTPYGFRSEKGRLIPIPEEQEVLTTMRALRKQGRGYKRIADALNEKNTKPRRGASWFATSVSRVLRADDERSSNDG